MEAVADKISNLEQKQKKLELSTVTTDPDVIGVQITEQSVSMNGITAQSFYVSRFDKRAYLSLFINFELVVLGGSTVDELFIALCCTSITAPVPEIRSLKVRNYARCNYEKTAPNPSIIISINMVTV